MYKDTDSNGSMLTIMMKKTMKKMMIYKKNNTMMQTSGKANSFGACHLFFLFYDSKNNDFAKRVIISVIRLFVL